MPGKKDRERFERTMLVHLDASYNLALWLSRDTGDAKDIVQIAYVNAFEHFESFTGGNAGGWMHAIVRNTAYNWLHKRKRNSNLISFDEVLHGGENDSSISISRLTPEEFVSADISSAQLMALIDKLAIEFREVLFLRVIEGYSYKEIAEIVGVPKGTVMSRLSRAREKLQRLFILQDRQESASGN